jgi:hypothetical protein
MLPAFMTEAANFNGYSIKGTVAPVRVWLKVVQLERVKIGEEPLMALLIFLLCVQIVLKFSKTAGLRGNNQKMS